jgi:hypothetical protein
MSTAFDLNLLPVARYTGREYPELVGLFFSEPPRRAARGRNLDRLILYLVMEGNAPLPSNKRDQALEDLAKRFYATPGSITAALRKTTEELNTLLLERNRQLGGSRQGVGLLTQVVLREQQATIAYSGFLHTFLIASGRTEHFYDLEMKGRGLGLSRVAPINFTQVSLQPNDTLLLAALPASDWSPLTLSNVYGQGPEGLRRRLLAQTSDDLNALVLQIKPGKGKFYLLQPGITPAAVQTPVSPAAGTPAQPSMQAIAPAASPEAPSQAAEPQSVQEAAETDAAVSSVAASAAAASAAANAAAAIPAAAIPAAAIPTTAGASAAEQGSAEPVFQPAAPIPVEEPALAQKLARAPRPSPFSGWLAAVSGSIAGVFRRLGGGLRTFFSRMLPGDVFQSIPSSMMAFIALAVPVVIVTAASVTYNRLGKAAQYDLLSSQAKQIALQAMEQTDLATRRADLGAALTLLQKASSYATTPESEQEIQALRIQVRNALDELDYVRRVSYQPAIFGGLEVTSNITRMTAFDDELYMLDSTTGEVIRAILTGQGYQIDYTFQCGPGSYGAINVGPIVDIVAWPAGYEPPAKLLATDSAGNALYCQPDRPPQADRLKPAAGENWGNILASTLDQGDFYALDLPSNGVWIYWRSNFTEEPTLFFDEEIPPLQQVIDMVVDRDDLYLLQSDGSLMLCVRNTLIVAPTRCSVVAYSDRRPGRENVPVSPPSPFSQMLVIPPPDPSLYFLEPSGQAIYHFSLRNLAFQKVLMPETSLPARPASAFTANHSRDYLYLALGNQVFYAVNP